MWIELGIAVIIVAAIVIYHKKKSREFYDRIDNPNPVENVEIEER